MSMTVVASEIESVRVHPQGARTKLEIDLGGVDIEALLREIDTDILLDEVERRPDK